MYLRTTRQRRKHGPDAIYYQLAENYYHKARRRSETRVIYTFGRADQVDPEALRRLVQSLLRVVNDERIALAARRVPPDVGIRETMNAEDRQVILDLIAQYGYTWDANDVEGF